MTTSDLSDLRLVALTDDRSHLVLEDSESRQFRVAVDERLARALRSDGPRAAGAEAAGTRADSTRTDSPRTDRPRPGQVEPALESQLSPREIQTRIRAGQSVDEVSHAAGIPADRVERYAGPVIAEREHVVELAQRAPARRASAGTAPLLLDLVTSRLAEQHASADSAEWDAWRTHDDRWTVRLSYLAVGRSRSATWTFDPRGRVLAPADDEARWLVDDSGTDREGDVPTAAVRRLSAVPLAAGSDVAEAAEALVADEVYDREADEARAVESPPAPAATARAGRRPALPSWDDIMFGARKPN